MWAGEPVEVCENSGQTHGPPCGPAPGLPSKTLWTDKSLLFGFLPVGLGFQMLISILAAIAWALVIKYAWPDWIEEWAESGEDS